MRSFKGKTSRRNGVQVRKKFTHLQPFLFFKDSSDLGVISRLLDAGKSPPTMGIRNTMHTIVIALRRAYELLVAGASLLQSPFLLALRLYFFWQLFSPAKASFPISEKSLNSSRALGSRCPP